MDAAGAWDRSVQWSSKGMEKSPLSLFHVHFNLGNALPCFEANKIIYSFRSKALIVFVLRLLTQTSKVNNKNQNGLFQWKHTNYVLLQVICGKICRGQHPEVASITCVLCQYNCFTGCQLNKQVHPRFTKTIREEIR